MNEDWTKDIQKLLADYEAEPPKGLLDDVKAKLQQAQTTAEPSAAPASATPAEKRGRVVAMWRYRWVAAAAVVAAIAIPTVWKLVPKAYEPMLIAGKDTPATVGQDEAASSMANEAVEKPSVSASLVAYASTIADRQPQAAQVLPSAETVGSDTSIMQASDDVATVKEDTPETLTARTPQPVRQETKKTQATKKQHVATTDTNYPFDVATTKDNSSSLTLMAYYGGGAGGNGAAGMRNMPVMADANPYGAYNVAMSGSNSKGFVGVAQHEKKANHAQPVKVGVSVGVRIADRWSVNTGVTYSYLSTDFTTDGRTTSTQKLHYAGIPLTGSYSIMRGKRAEVYVTAGGEVEKLVKGSTTETKNGSNKVKEDRPQWSVKAAVGGAYHFTPALSVYAEPGVSHHFDNHSSVVNVYKDRPTNFSLNLGLRIEP